MNFTEPAHDTPSAPSAPSLSHQIPQRTGNTRLAILLPKPHKDDAYLKEHLSSYDGKLLANLLGDNRIASSQCAIFYLSFNPDVDPDEPHYTTTESYINTTLALPDLISAFNPHCILALGRASFAYLFPSICSDDYTPIDDYRGSVMRATRNGLEFKTVIAHHPDTVRKIWGAEYGLFRMDIARAAIQARSPNLPQPSRHLVHRPTYSELIVFLEDILTNKKAVSFDIEGYLDHEGITEYSFATLPTECYVVCLWNGHDNYWSLEEEVEILRLTALILADAQIEKTAHNGFYELFCCMWCWHAPITNLTHDTMFLMACWHIEIPKSLATLASLYTFEPYYKSDRTSTDFQTRLLYNAKDSAVTAEGRDILLPVLAKHPARFVHYQTLMALLPCVTYMGLRGVRIDPEALLAELRITDEHIAKLTASLASSCGRPINPKSTPDKQWLLYDFLGYEPYKREGKSTKEVVLLRYYAKHRNPVVKTLIECVFWRTRRSDILKLAPDFDGRIRTNINLVGTDTLRVSSSESPVRVPYFTKKGLLKWENSGTNLQNVTKELRIGFTADDESKELVQFDLEGADGWTVAADLASLGYPAMLDDYLAGIKPAKVLLLMLQELEAGRDPASINRLDRTVIAQRCAALKFPKERDALGRPGDWAYICMKGTAHGSNYDMKEQTLVENIFKRSEGTIDLPARIGARYQALYELRYKVSYRHELIARRLRDKGYLVAASGFHRHFFGLRSRKEIDPNVLRAALSFEPQHNTTYVCNQVFSNLWYDKNNRNNSGRLFVEPLIQVHDAAVCQYPKHLRQWAFRKFQGWFNTELIVSGIKVKIPFSGGYGPNWKDTDNEF